MNRTMKASVTIGFSLLLFAGSLTFAQNNQPQPVQNLSVWDSKGKIVGNVISSQYGGQALVAFRLSGRLFLLSADKTGFNETTQLFFASANCTGAAYTFPILGTSSYLNTVYGIVGGKAYEPSGPTTNVTINSSLDSGSSSCNFSTVFQTDMTPMQFVVDLNSIFTPPFTLR